MYAIILNHHGLVEVVLLLLLNIIAINIITKTVAVDVLMLSLIVILQSFLIMHFINVLI